MEHPCHVCARAMTHVAAGVWKCRQHPDPAPVVVAPIAAPVVVAPAPVAAPTPAPKPKKKRGLLSRLLLPCVLLLAGCAHIQPIPCEELENATATGGRSYARLCP